MPAMTFETLRSDLRAARTGGLDIRTLAQRLRAFTVPPALPPTFGDVLADLADRLESGALFDGESCSFSQTDLLDALEDWERKARERLGSS